MHCNYEQGEASKIQNQKFYKSTLEAMRAKEYAKLAPEDQMHDAIPRQGSSNVASGQGGSADIERPAVPPAKDGTVEMEEIPIAGRTKMTVPKNKDIQDSASPNAGSESSTEEPVDHSDAKSELNSILKRSPSMIPDPFCIAHLECAKLTLRSS